MKTENSDKLLEKQNTIFLEALIRCVLNSVQGNPLIKKANGCWMEDEDGNTYLDLMFWGPMIVGHSNPDVINAVQEALLKGSSF